VSQASRVSPEGIPDPDTNLVGLQRPLQDRGVDGDHPVNCDPLGQLRREDVPGIDVDDRNHSVHSARWGARRKLHGCSSVSISASIN
jgi:hypothetical protein